MPSYATNLSPSAVTYAQELRVAFQLSSSLSQLSNMIGQDAVYQMSDGTMRDPAYVIKEGTKIRKFWRTAEDARRITKYNQYDRILLEGTQFLKAEWYRGREWADFARQNQHQAYNLCPLISSALTDLTVGGGCTISTGIESLDVLLNEDMEISSAVYQWIFEASVYGFVGVQVVADEEQGILEINRVLPHYLYVQRSSNRDREPLCISKKIWMPKEEIPDWKHIPPSEIVWGQAPTGNNCDGFVFEERHFKGLVENYLWAVKGTEITSRVPLKYFRPELPDASLTGLQDFAITVIPNEIRLGEYHSEWDDLISINSAFNDRASRVNELLNKYEAPNLMVGESQATLDPVTGKTYYRTPRQGVIVVRPQDGFEPKYLQPGVETSGSENNLTFLLKMISVLSQVAPVLLDPEKMEGVESGVAYKLKLTPTLAKVKRRATGQRESLKRVVFNIMSVINFYHDKGLAQRHLAQGAAERVKEELTARAAQCTDSLNRLGEAGARISLDSFDELFQSVDVLHSQPRGLFLQDPRLAADPEELNWFADQGLLDYIATKESEMFEIRKLKEIRVEFAASLPQDEAQALDRLGDKPSLSVKSYLMKFEDHTEEQADLELARIRDEEQTMMGSTLGGGLGIGSDLIREPIPDANNLQSDAIHAGTTPAAVNNSTGEDPNKVPRV